MTPQFAAVLALSYFDCLFPVGDKRSNVWSGLTAVHELFVKEHNRIAGLFYEQLANYYPYMSASERDETAYQETRRITGAMLQVRCLIY